MTQEEQNNYSGQNLEHTTYVNGNLETNPIITIARKPFLLERYDFDKVIKGESFVLSIANTLLGAVVGLFINMIAKLIGSKVNDKITFEDWEVYAFLVALVLMLICYGINKLVPNEKRDIINKIKKHFENS